MPLYEYRCEHCGQEFEELILGEEKVVCPSCGTEAVLRLISRPASPQVSSNAPLPMVCEAGDLPPCGPGCCRLPQV